MLGFNDGDAATVITSGLIGLAAGVILGPILDRNLFQQRRYRRAEAELDRLKALLNRRRSEVDLEERRLAELQEETAWLQDVRAETEIWTDRLNSVRVEVGNIDKTVLDLTDIEAELARCHQQRAAIKAEIQALLSQDPSKRQIPPPLSKQRPAESKAPTQAKPKPSHKPNDTVLDGVFRTVDAVFASFLTRPHRKPPRNTRPKR